jgi:hypothetical protein
MRPVDQTTLGGKDAEPPTERGDCLRACIASLLELDPQEVPHFAASDEPWSVTMNDWLGPRGLYAAGFCLAQEDEPPVPRIRVGPSPRGDWCHAVVVDADGSEHDPHPSRAGLSDREGDRYCILLLLQGLHFDPTGATL